MQFTIIYKIPMNQVANDDPIDLWNKFVDCYYFVNLKKINKLSYFV